MSFTERGKRRKRECFYKIETDEHRDDLFEYVSYNRFKDLELIAEGGFSKIYKATWMDEMNKCVVLKELDNSKNINYNELNELKIFHNYITLKHYARNNINTYFGITRNPITQNFIIITKYYETGDLSHCINNEFFNINWENKLKILSSMIQGLYNMHDLNIIHKDYHSGNIFMTANKLPVTGDLGLSKSAIESSNDDNKEIYGIIPYVAPEIFREAKYTKETDIYSFGMIMWELMTGRRPFWDKSHDTDLIIEICDGLRPPIITNAPEGYIELMQKCWHSDPKKRPKAVEIYEKVGNIWSNESLNGNSTKIIRSPDIGPIATNHSGAYYKSRPLSAMIKSVESTRNLRSQSIFSETDKIIKKTKLSPNEGNDYLTREFGFDIDNASSNKSNKNDYTSKEINFDI
ncbi:Ste11p [Rhizophagus irregularis DAOM 197198w]|uniref:Ste11p n=1 Tax=Rhizophagus irregularis (strain DAOM 197198w) TaxID=1432141 RepID=A0A015MG90_RHIIW|nr:Ste11p [Rhizophagus irregularis DAOM 197198w]